MAITVNIYYTGIRGSAKAFAREMLQSGLVAEIRSAPGNLGYDYFESLEDPETILLIDAWENQEALDRHHQSPGMQRIIELRERFDVHMRVERFISAQENPDDTEFIRK